MAFGNENTQAVDMSSPAPIEQKSAPSMVAVGVRAAFWTVVAIALCFACFLSFFSYTAMRFYTKLDLKEMALMSAEKYLSRHSDKYNLENNVAPRYDTKYVDALCCVVNNSIDFMDKALQKGGKGSQSAVYYAKKVDKYATVYINCLGVPDSTDKRTQLIDSYNLSHAANPALHPYVYSYSDYLQTARFKAWYILGDKARIIERINTVTTEWIYADRLPDDAEITWTPSSDAQTADLMLLLSQLSAYVDAELGELGLTQEINASKDRMLVAPTLANRALLSGVDKPFDLFMYDESDNGKDGLVVENGEFTNLYKRVTAHFSAMVDVVRQNARENTFDSVVALNNRAEARAKHLQYTYYLKVLNDFSRSMWNMTAVFSMQTRYFAETREADLQKSFDNWAEMSFVDDVYVWSAGYSYEVNGQQYWQAPQRERHDGLTLTVWYNRGLLYDYIGFWANNDGKNVG